MEAFQGVRRCGGSTYGRRDNGRILTKPLDIHPQCTYDEDITNKGDRTMKENSTTTADWLDPSRRFNCAECDRTALAPKDTAEGSRVLCIRCKKRQEAMGVGQ